MAVVLLRKISHLVESQHFDGTNGPQIAEWAGPHASYNNFEGLVIDTPQGWLKANVDDTVIHGPGDEWYPIKPEARERNFELAVDP